MSRCKPNRFRSEPPPHPPAQARWARNPAVSRWSRLTEERQFEELAVSPPSAGPATAAQSRAAFSDAGRIDAYLASPMRRDGDGFRRPGRGHRSIDESCLHMASTMWAHGFPPAPSANAPASVALVGRRDERGRDEEGRGRVGSPVRERWAAWFSTRSTVMAAGLHGDDVVPARLREEARSSRVPHISWVGDMSRSPHAARGFHRRASMLRAALGHDIDMRLFLTNSPLGSTIVEATDASRTIRRL